MVKWLMNKSMKYILGKPKRRSVSVVQEIQNARGFYGEICGKAAWETGYCDIGICIELMAEFDDAIKKQNEFCNYAVWLAQRIAEEKYGYKDKKDKRGYDVPNVKVTWGKWGARLELDKNKPFTWRELEEVAKFIVANRCWESLHLSTRIFTYGLEEKGKAV